MTAAGAFLVGPSRIAVLIRTGCRRGIGALRDVAVSAGLPLGPVGRFVHRFKRWIGAAILAVAAIVLFTWSYPTTWVVVWTVVIVLVAFAIREFLDTGAPRPRPLRRRLLRRRPPLRRPPDLAPVPAFAHPPPDRPLAPERAGPDHDQYDDVEQELEQRPQASSQLANAHETPMSAPAGMVVTEMKTPRRALVRASASETMPTTPASTATTAEKKLGVLIRFETGLTPSSKALGWSPKPRTSSEKRKVAATASAKPTSRAIRPCRILGREPWSIARATLVMAPYSGPTTMAATMRIWELVMMPTAPMSPATTRKR